MTATQSAEYLFGDSAVRPVANVYWRRLALWNIGWNYTSKKHNMHWLAREIYNFHTAKSFDAMGISEIFNVEEEHLHEERQVIMQHLVDALEQQCGTACLDRPVRCTLYIPLGCKQASAHGVRHGKLRNTGASLEKSPIL